jgi:hypothetical protein
MIRIVRTTSPNAHGVCVAVTISSSSERQLNLSLLQVLNSIYGWHSTVTTLDSVQGDVEGQILI